MIDIETIQFCLILEMRYQMLSGTVNMGLIDEKLNWIHASLFKTRIKVHITIAFCYKCLVFQSTESVTGVCNSCFRNLSNAIPSFSSQWSYENLSIVRGMCFTECIYLQNGCVYHIPRRKLNIQCYYMPHQNVWVVWPEGIKRNCQINVMNQF